MVPVEPAGHALPNECFDNVWEQMRREGGGFAYGWCIWEWPHVYLEAEHHSVWISPEGTMVDVTPKPEGETQILFLRDDTLLPDTTFTKRIENRRFSLKSDPDITRFFEAASAVNRFVDEHSIGKEAKFNSRDFMPLLKRFEFYRMILCNRYLRPNQKCWCGSGKKFKVCHKGFSPRNVA